MRNARFVSPAGLLLGLAALAGGCSSGDDTASSSATSGGSSGSTTGGNPGVPCDAQPAELSLGGTWAAFGRLSVTFAGAPGGAITICPTDQIGESTMLLLLTIAEDPADATHLQEVKATLCSIELPTVTALVGECSPDSDTLVSTQIVAPQALIDALPDIASDPVEGALTGRAPGAGVSMDRIVVTVGSTKPGASMPSWNLDDPACRSASLGHAEACETACVGDCDSLRDDDGDGYPGVTAHVCGHTPGDVSAGLACNADDPTDPGMTLQGRASIALEVNPKFAGTAESSCELSGTVDTSVLYNVVGADIYLGGGPIGVASAIRSLPSFQVDAAQSKLRAIRIDGQYGAPDWAVDPANAGAACASLIAHINDF